MNKIKNLVFALLSMSVGMTGVSCQNISTGSPSNSYKDSNLKATNVKDILIDDEIKCAKENTFRVKADISSPIDPDPYEPKLQAAPMTENDPNLVPIKESERGQGVEVKKRDNRNPQDSYGYFDPTIKIKIPYSVNDPLPSSDLTNAHISLVFKDEYKIRLKVNKSKEEIKKPLFKYLSDEHGDDDEEENKYNTKTKADSDDKKHYYDNDNNGVKYINNILKKYNLTHIIGHQDTVTEQKAEKDKIAFDLEYECNSSNLLSKFSVEIKNNKVSEIMEKLRQSNLVRQVNIISDTKSDIVSNDPIFLNSSILSVPRQEYLKGITKVSVDESIRYWYGRINAIKAQDNIKSQNITPANVAVIDSGGFLNGHEDRPAYVTKNGKEQYILCDDKVCNNSADPTSISYNPNNLTATATSGAPGYSKEEIHGSIVSHTIAAPINGKGTTGIAYNAKILPIKVSGAEAIPNAIKYIIDNNTSLNIRVINISMSQTYGCDINQPIENDSNVRDQIQSARSAGIITVISAGNQNNEIGIAVTNSKCSKKTNGYITSSAVVVGGTAKNTNKRWYFDDQTNTTGSAYGARVDIAAPAEDIVSADFPDVLSSVNYFSPNYSIGYGTSYSTPMVSATAALLMGIPSRPDLRDGTPQSVDKVKSLIIDTGTPIQTDKPLGSGTNNLIVPNGRLLNVNGALNIAEGMVRGASYVRLFNADFYSGVMFDYSPSKSSNPFVVDAYYKEDRMLYIPPSINRLDFGTFNTSCAYSWGYQIWRDSHVVYQSIQGIAGKRNPLRVDGTNAKNVYNSVINEATSGIGYNIKNEYKGADLWATGFWK